MRVIENGQTVDDRFWLPDVHPWNHGSIAVASLAAVGGLLIGLSNRVGDRRLVQTDMHRSALLVARFGEVGFAVLVTSAASLAVTAAVFPAKQWGVFIGGTLLLGVVYALLGMCLGSLLGRVSGVLVAFVVPFLDPGITLSPMLRIEPPQLAALLPGHGPFRLLIDAGLSEGFDQTRGLLIGFPWVIGLATVFVVIFATQTGTARRRARKAKHLCIAEAGAAS